MHSSQLFKEHHAVLALLFFSLSHIYCEDERRATPIVPAVAAPIAMPAAPPPMPPRPQQMSILQKIRHNIGQFGLSLRNFYSNRDKPLLYASITLGLLAGGFVTWFLTKYRTHERAFNFTIQKPDSLPNPAPLNFRIIDP